jgi:hypothetical protein
MLLNNQTNESMRFEAGYAMADSDMSGTWILVHRVRALVTAYMSFTAGPICISEQKLCKNICMGNPLTHQDDT